MADFSARPVSPLALAPPSLAAPRRAAPPRAVPTRAAPPLTPPAFALPAFAGLALAVLTIGLPASRGVAAVPAKQQAIVLDAQSADATSDNVVFRKVKITQGDMSISADQGQGTRKNDNVDFDDSVWVFRGNVKITLAQGQLTSEDAQITFYRQLLSRAVATGNPAVFEDHDQKTGKEAHGRAAVIDYDAAKGIVTLQKNAWLSDGQYDLSGDSLKYNVTARSIVAEGADANSQRVHIVVTPPPPKP
jgi:lipopolysaccharide transport protein LptA